MAARGLVNGRGPRSGRDLVFRCYPPELLLTPQKKKLTFWVSLFYLFPDQSDNQSEKEQHEDETADTAGDVAVTYKECNVIP